MPVIGFVNNTYARNTVVLTSIVIMNKIYARNRFCLTKCMPKLGFIIYKVMKYRKILIKYNAYLKKAVFHSSEDIKSCIFTAVKI